MSTNVQKQKNTILLNNKSNETKEITKAETNETKPQYA